MTGDPSQGNEPLRVLMVCTGNVCRSPLAERLLKARMSSAGLDVTVSSAGTSALVLEDMTPETSALVVRLGGDAGPHRARQLSEAMIAEADLVLTATREHRSAVVSMHPRAARYVYTLTQFARLVDGLREHESLTREMSAMDYASPALRRLISDVAAMRGFVPPPASALVDDIEDPYRRGPAVYERVGGSVISAVESVVAGMSSVVGRV